MQFDQMLLNQERLVSVYNRFAQLMNDLERNNMKFPTVSVNTKFLNSLQLEWLKYVTQVRLAKKLTVDSFDDLFDYLSQFEKLVNASRAKKLDVHNHSGDPLASLVVNLPKPLLKISLIQQTIVFVLRLIQKSSSRQGDKGEYFKAEILDCFETPNSRQYSSVNAITVVENDIMLGLSQAKVSDSKYFMEQMLLAKQDDSRIQPSDQILMMSKLILHLCLCSVTKPLWLFHDQQLKHGLGYPNPYTLRQAISECSKLYVASRTGNIEIPLNVRDSEETLEDALKSQQKMKEKMNDPIHKLNVRSNARRTFSVNSRIPKSSETTFIAPKTRFSEKATQSKTLDTTSVASKSKIAEASASKARDKVSSAFMLNKIWTSRLWQKWFESQPNVMWTPINTKPHAHTNPSNTKPLVLVKRWIVKLPSCPCVVSSCVAETSLKSSWEPFALEMTTLQLLQAMVIIYMAISLFVMYIMLKEMICSQADASLPICLMSNATSTKSWLWHRRLSHLNFGTINDLTKLDLVDGLPKFKYGKDHLCSACERGKSKKASHPPKLIPSDYSKLELLHMDLCGPMRVALVNGKKYILVIVNDFSRFTWDATLKAHYEKLGIMQQFSIARTPQQNGVVEQRNRTLVEAARTMLIFSRLPEFLWAEAVATACFTQNRSIINIRHNKTPYELLRGRKPNVEYFHVFGSLCYPTNDRDDLGKMKPKADIGKFSDTTINFAAQLTHDQEDLPFTSSIIVDTYEAPPVVTTSDEQTSPISLQESDEFNQEDSVDFDGNTQFVPYDSLNHKEIESSTVQNFHQVQPSTHIWIKDHPLDQVIGDPSKPVMTRQRLHTDYEVYMYVLTVSTIEPKNIKEAMADHSWIKSMQDKLNQFERLQVWELVPRPEGKNVIALKWLWKNKCDAENIVVRKTKVSS
ncbi:retrovirus-related pol polyprotein from transposon TNT 1-94 [Tanacetum coccineum]